MSESLVLWFLRPATLLKKRLWYRCFPVNFAKFLRTHCLQNTSWLLLLREVSTVWSFSKTKVVFIFKTEWVSSVFITETVAQRCSVEKVSWEGVIGKHLCQSIFINKRLWDRCFAVNFAKFLRTPFLIEQLWRLLLSLMLVALSLLF